MLSILHLSVFILKSVLIRFTSCNTAEDVLKAQALLKQYVYSDEDNSGKEVENRTKEEMYDYVDKVFNDEENEYNMIDDIHQLMNAELKEIEKSIFSVPKPQKNISQSLIPTCKIEWMMCNSSEECCPPLYCSYLPRFPQMEDLLNETISQFDIGQYCSRLNSTDMKDAYTSSNTEMSNILTTYYEKMVSAAKS